MSNSAANTDYPCRKATCCGEDDPFPNFTQGLIPYRMGGQLVQCRSYATPALPPPQVEPVTTQDCYLVTQECILIPVDETDECGSEETGESYLCALQKTKIACPAPNCLNEGNDEQTCYVECWDGAVGSYVLAANTVTACTKAEANSQAYSLACIKAKENMMCFDAYPVYCCVGEAFTFTFSITGGKASKVISILSGSLPSGLILSGLTISGTPTIAGTASCVLQVDDGVMKMLKELVMYAVEIGPASLGAATVGTAYSQQLTASGLPATEDVVWSLKSGILPPGLTLSAAGLISGTPTGGSGTFEAGIDLPNWIGNVVDSSGGEEIPEPEPEPPAPPAPCPLCQAAYTDPEAYFTLNETTGTGTDSIAGKNLVKRTVAGEGVAKFDTGLIGGCFNMNNWSAQTPIDSVFSITRLQPYTLRFWWKRTQFGAVRIISTSDISLVIAGIYLGLTVRYMTWVDPDDTTQGQIQGQLDLSIAIPGVANPPWPASPVWDANEWHYTVIAINWVGSKMVAKLYMKSERTPTAVVTQTSVESSNDVSSMIPDSRLLLESSETSISGDIPATGGNLLIDELAIWKNYDIVNYSTDLDFDYNSGNGRTYPV